MSTEVKKKKTAADGSADNVVSDVELKANTAALLCYLGLWVSGIIFLVLEQKNRVVRFHAAQSIVTFGFLMLVQGLLSLIPLVGDYFSIVIGILMLVLWIVLMVTAYRGEVLRLPLAAELAERLADVTKTSNDTTPADHEPVLSSPGTEVKTSTQAAAAVVVGKTGGSGEFYQTTWTQHTISYCFAIFW
ncbi:MAG TPA: DUF4870 domain-containing protein, partial [Dehalococcoidia bacterium]|nr:DUF4870 domain-containing protein [Dehalococcoidia bacterium]